MALDPLVTRGWTPLDDRCRLLLTGSDRIRYLNGQITNRADQIPPGQSRYGLLTNHKGQLQGDLFFATHSHPEGLVIDTDTSLRESLPARLDRYIIADDVQLTDITEDWRGLHALGISGKDLAQVPPGTQVITSNRFGTAGLDLWSPSSVQPSRGWNPTMTALDLPQLDAAALDEHRIRCGIPLWGRELTPGLLPPEARLEARAIDYDKGCYIGQEVISRMKRAGKINRLLVLLGLEPPRDPPRVGHSLWLPNAGEGAPPIGILTSLASRVTSATREMLALGFLRSHHAGAGTKVMAGPSPADATIQLTVLPFPVPHA